MNMIEFRPIIRHEWLLGGPPNTWNHFYTSDGEHYVINHFSSLTNLIVMHDIVD